MSEPKPRTITVQLEFQQSELEKVQWLWDAHKDNKEINGFKVNKITNEDLFYDLSRIKRFSQEIQELCEV